jgi:hypothetical protein
MIIIRAPSWIRTHTPLRKHLTYKFVANNFFFTEVYFDGKWLCSLPVKILPIQENKFPVSKFYLLEMES